MKVKIFIIFLIYGFIVGVISNWWQVISDMIFFPNIPGVMLGDEVYSLAIRYLGDPSSSQAHFTIPWILRINQVYVPVSIIFWGLLGLVIQLICNLRKRHISLK
ncbi:hypothetical protein ES703_11687 [subsurface metagenome]